ncbi:MAG: DUF308 domain-containing protein [Eubacterium sp.]
MNETKGPIEELEDDLEKTIKHWWLFLILGILAIGIGIWMFFNPLGSYVALSFIFAITFLVSGLSSIFITIINRNSIPAWGWNLTSGILMLILGIILLVTPGMSETTLAFYVAFAIMFGGFNTINFAFTLKARNDKHWGLNLALGIIVIILSIILISHPLIGAMTVLIWSSFALISLGVSFCVMAYRLSKTNAEMKKQKLS